MKNISIMQPTFLPWLGYFGMIYRCDEFVFLDDVQFSKRSWQSRNRIAISGKEHFLSLPVLSKGRQEQLISEACIIFDDPLYSKIVKTIAQAYRKAPFFDDLFPLVEKFFKDKKNSTLGNFNSSLIKLLCDYIDPEFCCEKFINSSELSSFGVRDEKLLNICMARGATTYLSAPGSQEYIEEGARFKTHDITVNYFDFKIQSYYQSNAPTFITHLSVLDALFNIGPIEVKKMIHECSLIKK